MQVIAFAKPSNSGKSLTSSVEGNPERSLTRQETCNDYPKGVHSSEWKWGLSYIG